MSGHDECMEQDLTQISFLDANQQRESHVSRILVAFIFSSVLIAGCCTTGSVQSLPNQKSVSVLIASTGLRDQTDGFSTDYQVNNRIVLKPPIASGDQGAVDQALVDRCTGSGNEAFLVAIAAGLVKALVQTAFVAADNKLEEALKEYQATFDGKVSTALVRRAGTGEILRNTVCFRFVRGSYDPKGKSKKDLKLDFDFLAEVKLIGGGVAYQIVPLRLMTDDPAAKRGEKVAYALSIGSRSFFVDGIDVGRQLEYPETTLVTGHYKASAAENPSTREAMFVPVIKRWRYAEKMDAKPSPYLFQDLPIFSIPGRINRANDDPSSIARFEFKVAEAGGGGSKKNLQYWRTFLSKAGGGIADASLSAVTELLTPEEPEDEEADDNDDNVEGD